MKILAIVGSLRKESLNLQLASLIKEKMSEHDFEIYTLEDIPFFNEDIEIPAPKVVEELREKVSEADLVWFFTPEYNHSYSGVMKNTIDWLSRDIDEDNENVLDSKKAVLSGASWSVNGTGAAQDDMVKLLGFLNMDIMMQPRLTYGSGKLPTDDDKFLREMLTAVNKFLTK